MENGDEPLCFLTLKETAGVLQLSGNRASDGQAKGIARL